MLGSMFNSDADAGSELATAPHIAAESEGQTYGDDLIPDYYKGNIEPMDLAKNRIELWSKPGGHGSGGIVVGNLRRGAEVTVIRFEDYQGELWALVSVSDVETAEGWLPERDIAPLPGQAEVEPVETAQPAYLEPYEPEMSEISSGYERIRPRFMLQGEFSYPVFTDKSIREEYSNSDTTKHAYRFGVEAAYFIRETMNIGVSIGYLHASGVPKYDYEAPGLLDSPQDSKLQIWNYGIQFGQLFQFGRAGFFSYGIAPTAYRISERATIMEYEGGLLTGARTEELSKWRFGGELNLKIGGFVTKNVPLSFSVRYSLISWKSEEEKSLTFDYLDSSSISLFSFGVNIGYSWL
jgi:hypothetical protein